MQSITPLSASKPRSRYRVGKHATLLSALAAFLPDRLLDAVRFRITGMPTGFGSLAPAADALTNPHA
jgi:hypothetical protein